MSYRKYEIVEKYAIMLIILNLFIKRTIKKYSYSRGRGSGITNNNDKSDQNKLFAKHFREVGGG